MSSLDNTTVQLIYLVFTIILIVFITSKVMDIIADFFHKIFNAGKKKYDDK